MARAGGRTGIPAAGVLGLGRTIGTGEVAGFDELDDGWVLEGFGGDLSGFAGAEEELFSAGEGNTDGFAGFV